MTVAKRSPADETSAPGLDVSALAPSLATAVGGLGGALHAQPLAGGRSNPTYVVTDGVREWILRRPPYGLVLQSAHDMSREVRVVTALRDSAVPVPDVVLADMAGDLLGVPCYVMDRLVGRIVARPEDAHALDPAQRRRLGEAMADTLATLHSVDAAAVGLADWGNPDGFLDRQLRLWRRQWAAAHTVERPEVDELLDLLAATRPPTRRSGILHGDFKLDNVMVDTTDPGTVVGVLDWEMSTRGDTLADVGVLLSFWDEPGEAQHPLVAGLTALPGFPSRAELLERYTRRSGADVADVDWYVVLADVKIAIILEQIHTRRSLGHASGDASEDVGAMVGQLLARAHELASRLPRPTRS